MTKVTDNVKRSFDVIVNFFLLTGSIYFISYAINYGKIIYLLLATLIYVLSYLIRNKLIHVKYNSGFTEIGIFFITFLFTAYLLYVLGIDKGIASYLPDKILVQSGFAFVLIFLSSFLVGFSKKGVIPIFVLILVVLIFSKGQFENYFNNLFLENERISDIIIGFPLIYLTMTVFGLNSLVDNKQSKSKL